MKPRPRHFAALIAGAGVMFAAAAANAQTCTLELKRLESLRRSGRAASSPPADYVYRTTIAQSFFMQIQTDEKGRVRSLGMDDEAAAFKRIVTKEPAKYESEHPFRGVAKLGSQEYAFVLDTAPAETASKDAESASKDAKSASKDLKSDSEDAESGLKSAESDSKTAKSSSKRPKALGYSRLYFDLNHNGDLTDDKVIEADQDSRIFSAGFSRCEFPPVDLTIDAEGTPVDYAFFFSVYSNTSKDYSYASASLNAAAYREGEITLDGKRRHLVLLDFNSNGRFDDQCKINKDVRTPDGRVYPTLGDMLLVDPEKSGAGVRSLYDVTAGDDRHCVSKLVNIDGRFYDLKISPAGDKLTLTPSSAPVGYVTNPNEGFRALVYGDQGVVKISGGKSKPAVLPEGDWKLLEYTIDQSGYQKPASQPGKKEKDDQKPQQGSSLLQALAEALLGGAQTTVGGFSGPRYTSVSAQATRDYPAVKVRKGETAVLPFGPPYKPVVKAQFGDGKVAALEMSLLGSAGEVCTNLMVDGGRPESPKFTISTPKGEVVESGKFEFG